jgi:branched-chain amino acid aminotransferase
MKGYTDAHGKIRLFRPDMNMKRMDSSMQRMAMPALDKDGFLECIEELIRIDSSWVPSDLGYSLYIRPFAIGTSVSSPIRLFCLIPRPLALPWCSCQ